MVQKVRNIEEFIEVMKTIKPDHSKDLTIEQILEIEEYQKQGKMHPLMEGERSLMDIREELNRYTLSVEDMLMTENFIKYLKLMAENQLEEQLLKLQKRIERRKKKFWKNYQAPRTDSHMEAYNHRLQAQSEIEEIIYQEIVVPFVFD